VSPSGRSFSPAVSHGPSGDFVISWLDASIPNSIRLQRYDVSGDPIGSTFSASDPSNPIADLSEPALAVGPAGDFVVTWSAETHLDDPDLLGRHFSAAGTPIGSNFEISAYEFPDFQAGPSIDVDANGNFVAVWDVLSEQGSVLDSDVFGRRLSFPPHLPSMGAFGLLCLAALALVAGARSLHPRRRVNRE
jgi:hypothetical protein